MLSLTGQFFPGGIFFYQYFVPNGTGIEMARICNPCRFHQRAEKVPALQAGIYPLSLSRGVAPGYLFGALQAQVGKHFWLRGWRGIKSVPIQKNRAIGNPCQRLGALTGFHWESTFMLSLTGQRLRWRGFAIRAKPHEPGEGPSRDGADLQSMPILTNPEKVPAEMARI